MRLALLVFFAVLVLAALLGQVVLAQEVAEVDSAAASAPAAPGIQVSFEAVMASVTALITAVGVAIAAGRKAWAAIQQLRAVIRGVEKAGDPMLKAQIQTEAEKAGVEKGLAKAVQKETKRMDGGQL